MKGRRAEGKGLSQFREREGTHEDEERGMRIRNK